MEYFSKLILVIHYVDGIKVLFQRYLYGALFKGRVVMVKVVKLSLHVKKDF